jgi:hypothetical protein
MSKQKKWQIHAKWTQPYNTYNNWTEPGMTKQELKMIQELARWDYVDEHIQKMETYPDAKKLIRKIQDKG